MMISIHRLMIFMICFFMHYQLRTLNILSLILKGNSFINTCGYFYSYNIWLMAGVNSDVLCGKCESTSFFHLRKEISRM